MLADRAPRTLRLHPAVEFAHMSPMPKSDYERITFIAPAGTRKLLRSAAALAGEDWRVWSRELLHAHALEEHAKRGVEYEDPPEAHPRMPPPLQDRPRR